MALATIEEMSEKKQMTGASPVTPPEKSPSATARLGLAGLGPAETSFWGVQSMTTHFLCAQLQYLALSAW